jgi:transposase
MTHSILGIDVSKQKLDIALLRDGKFKTKAFKNQETGFEQLLQWLRDKDVIDLHVCLESTGQYGDALATVLHDAGYQVSIVNPARIKGFAQSELIRTKTDASDARLIARFCLALNPSPWTPPSKEARALQALVRRLESLLEMRQQECNRLGSSDPIITEAVEEHITYLDAAIEKTKQQIQGHIDDDPDLKNKQILLQTIPGIGEATIRVILAEFANINQFNSAKQLASFLGIAPRHFQSGSSVNGRTRMSKIGNANLRKAFYFPAVVSLRYNPVIKRLCQRLEEKGKPKMLIIGAAMRKLIHIIYGVLKHQTPFNQHLHA